MTAEYATWVSVIGRCTNPKNKSFARYGGAGIAMCDRWRNDFELFLADMGAKPSPTHSIDRIDNSRGYEPGNCRWATTAEQARNRKASIRVEINGETIPLADACEARGLKYYAVWQRLYRLGWSVEKALAVPVRPAA